MVATPFKLHAQLTHFWKSGDGPKSMRIGGIVSTDSLDQQNERVIQSGLDFKPFLKRGWFNDNHKPDIDDVLGYPTDAKYVRKGQKLPDGTVAKKSGWWTEGYLLDTKKGRDTWELAQSLTDTPRRLGFSIEGSVLERDPMDKGTIKRASVRNVAITHCPVNTDTELTTLAKALTAGSSLSSSEPAPGEGFALRTESLDDEDDEPTDVQKAENRSATETIDELDLFAQFESAIREAVANPPEIRLTKSEARIIIESRFHHLPPSAVDKIVKAAFTSGSGS